MPTVVSAASKVFSVAGLVASVAYVLSLALFA